MHSPDRVADRSNMDFSIDHLDQHRIAIGERELAPNIGWQLDAPAADYLATLDIHVGWIQ